METEKISIAEQKENEPFEADLRTDFEAEMKIMKKGEILVSW